MEKRELKNFFLYFIVGVIATLTEWLLFFVLFKCHIHYTFAVVIAYILSTFVNWLAGRILVFKKYVKSFLKEISGIYIVGVIGLSLNLLIMWVAVDIFNFNEMLSKIIATALVFVYNYLARKYIIYKK